jgi:sRNA-binding carbon storage regulator CsrA
MLALSRKRQESVVAMEAGDVELRLKVTVLGTTGGTVRLGSQAETDVHIQRWEMWERDQAAGQPNLPKHGPVAPVP